MSKRHRHNKKKVKGNPLIPLVVIIVVFTIVITVVVRAMYSTLPTKNANLAETSYQTAEEVKNEPTCQIDTIENAIDGFSIPDDTLIAISLLEQALIPDNIPSLYLKRKGYSLSYNLSTYCPNWVAWTLTKQKVNGRWKRTDDYRGDRSIPFKDRVDENTYKSLGYDRGHMCPAGDMSWDADAMSESFLMTNMCPQIPTLNHTWWNNLEKACRRWAEQEEEIYICCGPIFEGGEERIGREMKVAVPSKFFKVVLSLRKNKEKAIGFIFNNDDSRQPVGEVVCTVDRVEELTGYDFFSLLDDELEERVESVCNLAKWN